MHSHADVAVVGAGILGLAHAALCARAGKRVVVFEKNPQARGASVRNFGMIWPIGQPQATLETALRSRSHWMDLLAESRLPFSSLGSLHVIYREDEEAVAREFVDLAPGMGYQAEWLPPEQTLQMSPVRAEGLRGAIYSATEMNVDPFVVVAKLPAFLAERYGVQFRFGQAVREIRLPLIDTGLEKWQADTAIVCSGDDFHTLYPRAFAESGITRVKLQMMRTVPQPGGWSIGPALAAGLTLRFYRSFQVCPSLPRLERRIVEESPEYERWGIHVLVSQTAAGEITIGDSHEYGLDVDPFDKALIDDLILRYLAGFLPLPDPRIAQRWQGVYAKHPDKSWVCFEPDPGVRVVTAPGGAGMTLSFGIAERTLQEIA